MVKQSERTFRSALWMSLSYIYLPSLFCPVSIVVSALSTTCWSTWLVSVVTPSCSACTGTLLFFLNLKSYEKIGRFWSPLTELTLASFSLGILPTNKKGKMKPRRHRILYFRPILRRTSSAHSFLPMWLHTNQNLIDFIPFGTLFFSTLAAMM